MTDHVSTLRVDLTGNLGPEAKAMGEALLRAAEDAKRLDAVLEGSGATKKMQDRLRGLGAGVAHVDAVTAALKRYREEEGLAASRGDWTKEQAAGMRSMEATMVAAVRARVNEERAASAAVVRAREEEAREARRLAEQELAEQRRVSQQRADMVWREAARVGEARRQAHARELAEERRHMERVAEQRREAEHRMSFSHYVAGGVVGAVSAHGVVRGIEKAAEKGNELQDLRISMGNSGIGKDELARIERNSLALSHQYGNVSQTAVMELAKDARSVLKDVHEVDKVTAILAKAHSALELSGGHSEGLGQLVKGAESIGAANDPERLAKLIDGYVKAIQVMGTTINPEQIYEFDKYAKTAGATMSDRFLMTTGLSLSQEMGGSTAANDIFHAQKDITGAFPNKHMPLKELTRLGLVDRSALDVQGGVVKGVLPGREGVKGASVAQTDLDKWVYDVLLPAMEKHGIRTEAAQLAEIGKIFTGGESDVIGKLITQRESFENHAKLYGAAAGTSAADAANESAAQGVSAVSTALGNLAANVTSGAMAPVGRLLYHVADGLNYLAEAAAAHPDIALAGGVLAGGAALYGAGKMGQMAMNGFGGAAAAAEQTTAAGTQVTAAEMQLRAAGVEAEAAATEQAAAREQMAAAERGGVGGLGNAGGLFGRYLPFLGMMYEQLRDLPDQIKAVQPGEILPAPPPTGDALDDGAVGLADRFRRWLRGADAPGTGFGGDRPDVEDAQAGRLYGTARRYSEEARARRPAAPPAAAAVSPPPAAPPDPDGYWARKNAYLHRGDAAPATPAAPLPPPASAPAGPAPADSDAGVGYTPIGYVEGGADSGPVEAGSADQRLELAVAAGTEAGVLAALAKAKGGGLIGGDGVLNASLESGGAGDLGGGGGGGLSRSAASIRYGRQHSGAGGGGDVGGSATAMGGDEAQRRDRIMAKLQGLGWTREAAAAATGNAQQESGIRSDGPLGDTARFGTGDDAAHGMFQWRGSRFRALEAYAAKKGTSWKDFDTQVEFFDQESKRYGSDSWRKSGDVVEANRGMQRFEGYGDHSFGTRLANARQVLAGKSGGGFYAAAPGAAAGAEAGGGAAPSGDAVAIAGSLLGQREAGASRALNHVMHAGEWCADFVNGTIEKAGGRGSGSAMASSFMNWGKAVALADAKRGDVIMENSGAGTRVHHAGLVESVDRDKAGRVTGIYMISGNYGHMVKRNLEPMGIIAGLRRGNEPAAATPDIAAEQRRARATGAGRVPRPAAPAPETSAQIFDHEHLHGTLALVRQIRREVADLGTASVSVVSGAPKGQGRGRSTPASVGRALRGAPASSGSRIA